jgi:tetratricopeptide (TPR) repeat protein
VLDADGQVIKTWTTEAAGLWESAGAFQIRIQAKLGRRIDSLEGGSFALPVAIAEHVKGQISPFAFLATGAIRDGQLAGVSGCEAKAELGQKLGVRLWVQPKDTPAQNAAHGQLVIPPGTPIREVMDLVLRAFGEEGIWELTPSHANDLLRQIQPRESSKRHPLERAISLVEKCLAVLQKNNRFQRQNITRGQLLLAELLNHAGRERDADPLFREILDENAEDWELQGAAGASWVVSLCFQGRLEEAVAEGEKLFEKLESFPEDVKGLEARVKVAGAFGGDALLHKALRLGDAPLAMKSRECLENNLAYARELVSVAANSRETDIDPKVSLGMSISRLAVWYALFEPNRTHEKVDQALRDLPVLDGNVQFLRRTRFLGAFRLLLQNTLPDAIDGNTWDLPSDNAPHYIRATALKYRAAIRAAQGDIEGATQDFAEAFAPLSQDTSPTIRLIAWSIAAQAVLRLPNEQSVTYELHLRENVPYVVHYLSGFDPSRELAGVFASRNWTQDHLVEFQRGFAY